MKAPERYDSKKRRVYKTTDAIRIAGQYRCAECGGALLTEGTLDTEGKITFDYEVVFCQHHPTAKFKSKWEKKERTHGQDHSTEAN